MVIQNGAMKNLENKGKLVAPTPVRFTERTNTEIDKACEKLGLAKQDVIRLAVDIGLEHLETVKYNLARAILNESGKLRK